MPVYFRLQRRCDRFRVPAPWGLLLLVLFGVSGSPVAVSQDCDTASNVSRTTYGTNAWRGYVYGGLLTFSPYKGLVTETTPSINRTWGPTYPECVSRSDFTMRYLMTSPLAAEFYEFTVKSDNGARLSLNTSAVTDFSNLTYQLNTWNQNGYAKSTLTYQHTGGNLHLVLEYTYNHKNGNGQTQTAKLAFGMQALPALGGTLSLGGSGCKTLTWKNGRGYYQLQTSTDNTTWTDSGTLANTQQSATASWPISPTDTTHYRVKVVSGGDTQYSNTVTSPATCFDYTGNSRTYTVPANTCKLQLEMWGGGGAYNKFSDYNTAGAGGPGGYVKGELIVSPCQVLTIKVAGGGRAGGSFSPPPASAWPGGGNACYISGNNSVCRGLGGGYSGIFSSNSTQQQNALVIGGGGGGSSWGHPLLTTLTNAQGTPATNSAWSPPPGLNSPYYPLTANNVGWGGSVNAKGDPGRVVIIPLTNTCPPLPPQRLFDHIRIEHSGSDLTCQPSPVKLTLCADADCSTTYRPTDSLSVSLAVTPAQGQHLDYACTIDSSSDHCTIPVSVTTPGNASFSAAYPSDSRVSSPCVNNPCTHTFAESGFIFKTTGGSNNTIDTHVACQDSAENIEMWAVKANEDATKCVDYFKNTSQQHSINAKVLYANPGAGSEVTIAGTDYALNSESETTIPTVFENSKATFKINYPDAGKIQLYAKLNETDPNAPLYGVNMEGTSDAFVVRPAKLVLAATKSDNTALNGTTATSATSHPAGDDFKLTLKATCDDQTTVTKHFQLDGITLTPSVTTGSVSGELKLSPLPTTAPYNKINLTATDEGSKTVNVNVSEVGVFDITAHLPNYLDQDISALNPTLTVGRFIPKYFEVTKKTDGSLLPACVTDNKSKIGFTYAGQVFGYNDLPTFRIKALNAPNNVTQNYGDTLAKLNSTGIGRAAPSHSDRTLSSTVNQG